MEKENLPSFLSSQEMSPMQHIVLHKFSPSPTPTAHPVQVVDKIFVLPAMLCVQAGGQQGFTVTT